MLQICHTSASVHNLVRGLMNDVVVSTTLATLMSVACGVVADNACYAMCWVLLAVTTLADMVIQNGDAGDTCSHGHLWDCSSCASKL